jgi:hypothetical protein
MYVWLQEVVLEKPQDGLWSMKWSNKIKQMLWKQNTEDTQ